MASATGVKDREVIVAEAEKIVSAAANETKARVPSRDASTGTARAWDARAQID